MQLNRYLKENVGGSGKKWVFQIWVMGWMWASHPDQCSRHAKLVRQGVELSFDQVKKFEEILWDLHE